MTALNRLRESECRFLSVVSAGHMVGIVDLDNIVEMIKIQTALNGRNGAVQIAQ